MVLIPGLGVDVKRQCENNMFKLGASYSPEESLQSNLVLDSQGAK